jgi:hypothetical protein
MHFVARICCLHLLSVFAARICHHYAVDGEEQKRQMIGQ